MTKLLDIVCETTVSNPQARRLIQQGAVKMNGIRVQDPEQEVPEGTVIDIGKRRLASEMANRVVATFKAGNIVVPITSVAGCPIGLTTDTRCVVRKVDARGRKVRVQREDGRTTQTFTLDFDAVRRFGG